MKLSFDWLSDYVDLSGITPQELADKLTMGAFEVEEVSVVGADLQGPLVVGEIMEIRPHPNADKIRLTKTRVAPGAEPLEIVCGAQNIEVGQIVPVALPGARVIDRKSGGPLAIKASAIRGVHSNGMLCSPSELGISGDGVSDPEAGILILDRATMESKIGQDARDILSLRPDYVLHVEPRSNRGDALSVIGLAREVAALLNRPLKEPDWSVDENKAAEKHFKTSVESEDDCAFLSIRLIKNLVRGKLPGYISKRLSAIGMRSVSPIVDITNYVMHELGQPLHAYDLQKLQGNELSARRAREGEILETLDGKKRALTGEMLVIADSRYVVGVAGVMGSKDSEISDSTTAIALEAASFAPARVRRASRLLGLSSDASLRFERGVDPAGSKKASDRAAYLISKYCTHGSETNSIGEIVTAGSDKTASRVIDLRLERCKRILGVEFTAAQVKQLITPLGFVVDDKNDGVVSVQVPSFRQTDVTREIDLVEEVCRLWGYEQIPITMPAATIAAAPLDTTFQRLRQSLSAWGFSEALLSSLTGPATLGQAAELNTELVRVLNPLSVEHQVLRDSLLPGLVQAAAYNYSRGRKKVWLFEIGRTYLRSDISPFGTGVIEPNTLGAVLIGDPEENNWQGSASALDLYRTKGFISNILSMLKIDPDKVRFLEASNPPEIFHPAKAVDIYFSHRPVSLSDDRKQNEKPSGAKSTNEAAAQGSDNSEKPKKSDSIYIGRFGELHPRKADDAEMRGTTFLFEINLDVLKPLSRGKSFKETSNTPAVFRDITVDLPEQVTYAAVRSCILAEGGQILKDVELVSTFKPPDNLKSLSFRLRLQHPDKTMTAEEIDKLIDKVKAGLVKRLGATYR